MVRGLPSSESSLSPVRQYWRASVWLGSGNLLGAERSWLLIFLAGLEAACITLCCSEHRRDLTVWIILVTTARKELKVQQWELRRWEMDESVPESRYNTKMWGAQAGRVGWATCQEAVAQGAGINQHWRGAEAMRPLRTRVLHARMARAGRAKDKPQATWGTLFTQHQPHCRGPWGRG